MNVKREIEEFVHHQPLSLSCHYYNHTAESVPESYNKDNIICQFIENHHTKRQHVDGVRGNQYYEVK